MPPAPPDARPAPPGPASARILSHPSTIPAARQRRLAYGGALLLGALLSLWCFPAAVLAGRLPVVDLTAAPDFQQHVVGQLYVLAQPWRWAMLVAPRLDAPFGTNVALTDSIPFELLLLRLLHPLLPGLRQGIGPFLALCWLLQPACAVFALRSAGERRLLPALAAALLAACLPTFLGRMAHAALCAHWIVLLAIGLHFRALRPADRASAWWLAGLTVLALLVQPYLMVMVAALLAAVPLTRLVRDRAWRAWAPPLLPGAAALLALAALGRQFGYSGGRSEGHGFGLYSMNLASPFWPARSSLFPGMTEAAIDATGGQYEGYQYLGAGLLLLLLLLLATSTGRRLAAALPRRHAGLLLMAAGLTLLAVSNQAYFLHLRLFGTRLVPPGGEQLRSSGRMFWPVAYLLLLAAVSGTCRAWPRLWPALLVASTLLQWADTGTLRRIDWTMQHALQGPATPADRRIDAILASARTVAFQPRLECDMGAWRQDMHLIYLAAARDLPVNTMYTARASGPTACHPEADRPRPLPPGTLLVLPGPGRIGRAQAWADRGAACGLLDDLVLCAPGAAPDGLVPLPPRPPLPLGRDIATADGLADLLLLEEGWSSQEAWGTWSDADIAVLNLGHPPGLQAVRVTLRLRVAPVAAGRRQVVVQAGGQADGQADGREVARWTVGARDADHAVVLPVPPGDADLRLRLLIEHPARVGGDPRRLGIGLLAVRIDPAP